MKVTINPQIPAKVDLAPSDIEPGKFFRAISSISSLNREEVFIRLDRYIYRIVDSISTVAEDMVLDCNTDSKARFGYVRYLNAELVCTDAPK